MTYEPASIDDCQLLIERFIGRLQMAAFEIQVGHWGNWALRRSRNRTVRQSNGLNFQSVIAR
jgi:hypothetical protein